MIRFSLPIFTLLAISANPAITQAQDEIKEFRAKEQVLVQKLTQRVSDALFHSRKLEKIDPVAAQTLLQDTLRQIKDASELKTELRTDLVRQLQSRLSAVEELVRARRITQEQKPLRQPERTQSRQASEPPSTRGPSSVARDFRENAKTATEVAQAAIRQRDANIRRIGIAIEKTPVYPSDDTGIAFPKNWAALTALRQKTVGQQLTAKEVAVLKSLNSVLSVNFKDDNFRSVIDYVQDRTGLTLIMDEDSMKDAMVEYDDKITFQANKISVRTLLKKVLGEKGLTYVIKEGAIQVMTPKKASDMVVVRSYPVESIVSPSFQAQMFGPYVAQAEMLNNAQQLILLIQSSIEPTYWQPVGPGSITFYAPTKSLQIRASSEIHYQLGSPGLFGR